MLAHAWLDSLCPELSALPGQRCLPQSWSHLTLTGVGPDPEKMGGCLLGSVRVIKGSLQSHPCGGGVGEGESGVVSVGKTHSSTCCRSACASASDMNWFERALRRLCRINRCCGLGGRAGTNEQTPWSLKAASWVAKELSLQRRPACPGGWVDVTFLGSLSVFQKRKLLSPWE